MKTQNLPLIGKPFERICNMTSLTKSASSSTLSLRIKSSHPKRRYLELSLLATVFKPKQWKKICGLKIFSAASHALLFFERLQRPNFFKKWLLSKKTYLRRKNNPFNRPGPFRFSKKATDQTKPTTPFHPCVIWAARTGKLVLTKKMYRSFLTAAKNNT